MSKLLIVGTVAFDKIETPFGKTEKILGGSGTYASLAASIMGVKTAVVSTVGGDFPEEYFELFQQKGIDTKGIEIISKGKTFFWSGKYNTNMNSRETLATELNVLADFNPIIPNSQRDASVVLLGNLHPTIQLSVLEQMNEKPKWAVLDTMNYWMDSALEELHKVLKHIDVITINDEEARQLSGVHSLVKAAKKIHEMGPEYVIIKKGEHGALLFNKNNRFYAPALPLANVFDPTGAGDSLAGGLCAYLVTATEANRFEQLKKAIIYGSCLASFCIEKFGAEKITSINKNDLNERLKTFKLLTAFDI